MTISPCASGAIGPVSKTSPWIMLHIRINTRLDHQRQGLSRNSAIAKEGDTSGNDINGDHVPWCVDCTATTIGGLAESCPRSLLARIVVRCPSIASPSPSTGPAVHLTTSPSISASSCAVPISLDAFLSRDLNFSGQGRTGRWQSKVAP